VRAACEAIGRDPQELVCAHAITVCCGSSPAELQRRAQNIGRSVEDLGSQGAAGTPDELCHRLADYRDVGASRSYLQVIYLDDLDDVALIPAEVMPKLAA